MCNSIHCAAKMFNRNWEATDDCVETLLIMIVYLFTIHYLSHSRKRIHRFDYLPTVHRHTTHNPSLTRTWAPTNAAAASVLEAHFGLWILAWRFTTNTQTWEVVHKQTSWSQATLTMQSVFLGRKPNSCLVALLNSTRIWISTRRWVVGAPLCAVAWVVGSMTKRAMKCRENVNGEKCYRWKFYIRYSMTNFFWQDFPCVRSHAGHGGAGQGSLFRAAVLHSFVTWVGKVTLSGRKSHTCIAAKFHRTAIHCMRSPPIESRSVTRSAYWCKTVLSRSKAWWEGARQWLATYGD